MTEAEPDDSLEPGRLFADRYRILALLGTGAFGYVYSVFDEGPLRRQVALKVLRRAEPEDDRKAGAIRDQFLVEIQLAGSLLHPHIAAVFDAGRWNGLPYMVQEFVVGRDLSRLLASEAPLSQDFVIDLACQLARGLGHAHRHGVLHQDIKPGNILIDAQNQVRIVDFGLARALKRTPTDEELLGVGTPGYAAPEQIQGREVDARADLFSSACVIYELLTGQPPFPGPTRAERLYRTLCEPPRPASQLRPDLHPALDAVLARALRPDPALRYADMEAFEQALRFHAQLPQPADAEALVVELGAALAAERCVLVLGAGAGDGALLARAARLPFSCVLDLGAGPALMEAIQAAGLRPVVLEDARETLHPGPGERGVLRILEEAPGASGDNAAGASGEPGPSEASHLERLFSRVEQLEHASDSVRARLASGLILYLGCLPEEPLFRQLHARLARLRPSGARGCYLAAADLPLEALRWMERSGIQALARDPAGLLVELASALTETGGNEPAAIAPGARPYKKLDFFEASDERIFFGREAETQRLLDRVLAHPFSVLYGASGTGKTSLVRAAVMPRLERAGFVALHTRVFNDPMAEIVRAVVARLGGERPGEGAEAAWLAARAQETRLMAIFVDQLEELFGRFGRSARLRFAGALQESLDRSDGRLRIVLSLRADFLGRLPELEPALRSPVHQVFYLGALSEAGARRAITGPATAVGLQVEEALIDQVLADVQREDIDPPQLQLVFDALYDALEPGARRLTARAYHALGGAGEILAHHLERVLEALPLEARAPVRSLLKAMVTSDELKSIRRLDEIARLAGVSQEAAARWLEALTVRRLVRPVAREDGAWFELSHEYLVREIASWLDDEERRLRTVRELLEQGMRSYRQLGLLLPQDQLRLIQRERAYLALAEDEVALLRASEKALTRSRRRWGGRLAIVLFCLLGVTFAWRYAVLSSSRLMRATAHQQRWTRSGLNAEQILSPIRIYRGRVEAWPIDGLLGFPDPVYETDLNLDQVKPEARNAMLAGVPLDPARSPVDQLLEQLSSTERIRVLVTLNRIDEAVTALTRLSQDPLVDASTLLQLLPAFSLSRDVPAGLAIPALRTAARAFDVASVDLDDEARGEELRECFGLLLRRIPRAHWIDDLQTRARYDAGLYFAASLLEAVGSDADSELALRAIASHQEPTALAGWRALSSTALCNALPQVRVRLDRVAPSMSQLEPVLSYLEDCGRPEDIPRLERLVEPVLMASDNGDAVQRLVAAARRLSPEEGTALLERALARTSRTQLRPLMEYLAFLPDPAMIEVLRRHYQALPQREWPTEVLKALGNQGDATVVRELWRRVRADPGQRGVRSLIRVVNLYKDPELTRTADDQRNAPLFEAYRFARVEALATQGDAEAVRALAGLMGSHDSKLQSTAQDVLRALKGPDVDRELQSRLQGSDVPARLDAAFVLQARQRQPYTGVFQAFLEDGSSGTYLASRTAIRGLAQALTLEPPERVLEALRSPLQDIRLAANLALVERPDGSRIVPALERMARTGDALERMAASRAVWAVQAGEQSRALDAEGDWLLGHGQARRALQLVVLAGSPHGGVEAVLERALAPQRENAILEPDWMQGRNLEARVALWEPGSDAVATHFAKFSLRPLLAGNPRLAPLRSLYAFRVLTMLEPRRTIPPEGRGTGGTTSDTE